MREIKLVQGKEGIELPYETGNWVLLKEQGYSPVEMLVASVAACGAYVLQSILSKSHIAFEFSEVTASYTRSSEQKSQPLSSIEIVFELSVAKEHESRVERLLALVNEYCPVIQSLSADIVIKKQIRFK